MVVCFFSRLVLELVYEANFASPILNMFMSLDCRQSIIFSVEVHYGGFFCGLARNRVYVDKKVD